MVFHNNSKHDHNFIINELVKELEAGFNSFVGNNEKHKTCSVSITKTVRRIDKDGVEIT